MAFIQYLKFNGVALPLPTSYEVSLRAVEADSSGETEAGTTQRDVVREGVVKISVAFAVSPTWLKKLTAFSKERSLDVSYFDTETLESVDTQMYVDDYKVSLVKDTSYNGRRCKDAAEETASGSLLPSVHRRGRTAEQL